MNKLPVHTTQGVIYNTVNIFCEKYLHKILFSGMIKKMKY